ncbi:hypothetical protein IP88_13635 [alpha proteobacterium AAP81b]|nr:hypothetical protein IP88_13635 [alpha proteobacterium AAP81b]
MMRRAHVLPLEGRGDSPQASGRGWSPPDQIAAWADHPHPPRLASGRLRLARVASPLQGEDIASPLRTARS